MITTFLIPGIKRIEQKNKKRNQVVNDTTELQQKRQSLMIQWQDLQIAYQGHQKDLEQSQNRVNEIEEQLAQVVSKEQGLQTQNTEFVADRDNLEAQFQEAEKKRQFLLKKIDRMNEQITSERNKRREVDQSSQELEIKLASRREKRKSILSSLDQIVQNQVQVKNSIDEQKQIIESDEASKLDIADQIENSQKVFLQLEQDKFTVVERVEELATEQAKLLATTSEAQKLHRQMRRQYEKQNRIRHQMEVTQTQLQMQIKAISANIQDKYQVEIEELKSDLPTESTYQAIQKINQTSKIAFLDTFTQIRTNFQIVFAELFNGGETELRLTDEEDILESGVDIIASPPGKRPQTITQLSGGERSLVAVALLFAIFKIKPSPFCVMDEVDAALDESNVLRFTNLVQAYAKQTQFVIITHNKRTMETADVMYGVTMEQAGVSKLVSAKLSDYN